MTTLQTVMDASRTAPECSRGDHSTLRELAALAGDSLRELSAARAGIEACLAAWPLGSLRDLERRMQALDGLRDQPAFESLAVAFKRSFNIAKDVPPGRVDDALLSDAAERDLASAYRALEPELERAVAAGDYAAALTAVAERLRTPIDRFFDEVFVMVEDAAVRDNRLRLLAHIASAVKRVAHFHLLATSA